jgi:hypothetical protein
MTLPWAVEPDDRRLPSALAKPAPSKVGDSPEAAPEEPADDAAAPAADDAEPALDVTLPAADVADDDVVVVLLSLPQAPSVNAPTATKAMRPLIRVIFTHSSIESYKQLSKCIPCSGTADHRRRPTTWGP